MDNKKYLDKVIDHMVRSTKIDYEKEIISPSFHPRQSPFSPFPFFPPLSLLFSFLYSSFYSYCKNTFGLTEEEIEYVWEEYKDIINDKISKREP